MRRKPTPGLCTAESREAWSHLPAILSSHTCARPSSRVCVCACVWVCTPAGLQLCLRVCTCVTVHFRIPSLGWEDPWVGVLGLGRSLGEGKGYPLQYSGLENSMDCIVHGITKSQT